MVRRNSYCGLRYYGLCGAFLGVQRYAPRLWPYIGNAALRGPRLAKK